MGYYSGFALRLAHLLTRKGWAILGVVLLTLFFNRESPAAAQDQSIGTFDLGFLKMASTVANEANCQEDWARMVTSTCWGEEYDYDVTQINVLQPGGGFSGKCGEYLTMAQDDWIEGVVTGQFNESAGQASFTLSSTIWWLTGRDDQYKSEIKVDISVPLTNRDPQYDIPIFSGLADAKVVFQSTDPEYTQITGLPNPRTCTGKVDWALTLEYPQPSGERIEVTPINNDLSQPQTYQPFSYRVRLTNIDSQGLEKPVPNMPVRVIDPWAETPFYPGFQASKCANCNVQMIEGSQVWVTKDRPQDIILTTDANGEATLTLYPDLTGLNDKDRLPTVNNPLKVGLTFKYDAMDKEYSVSRVVETTLNSLGIIEDIYFINPTITNRSGQEISQSRATFPMRPDDYRLGDYMGENFIDPGYRVGNTTLAGAQRVRVIRDGVINAMNADNTGVLPGEMLEVGELVNTSDHIKVIACDIPYENRANHYPPQIAVRLRTWDGVRSKLVTAPSSCIGDLLVYPLERKSPISWIGDALDMFGKKPEWAELDPNDPKTVGMFVIKQDAELVVTYFFPAVMATYKAGELASKWYGLLRWATAETYYVRIKSSLMIEHTPEGEQITTRQGEPEIHLPNELPAVPVPAGQTALLPPGGQPVLGPTDADIAREVDRQLSDLLPPGITSSPGKPSAATPAGNKLILAGISVVLLCGFGMAAAGGLGAFFYFRQKRTRQIAPAQPKRPIPSRSTPAAPGIGVRSMPVSQPQPIPAQKAPIPMARLTLLSGSVKPPYLELNSPSLSIGRDGTCNLVVPDKLVSRHHARLAWTTQGWVIYDQGSANGVYVNGQRVSQHTLRPGDQVQIGQTVLVFQISASQSRGTPGA